MEAEASAECNWLAEMNFWLRAHSTGSLGSALGFQVEFEVLTYNALSGFGTCLLERPKIDRQTSLASGGTHWSRRNRSAVHLYPLCWRQHTCTWRKHWLPGSPVCWPSDKGSECQNEWWWGERQDLHCSQADNGTGSKTQTANPPSFPPKTLKVLFYSEQRLCPFLCSVLLLTLVTAIP